MRLRRQTGHSHFSTNVAPDPDLILIVRWGRRRQTSCHGALKLGNSLKIQQLFIYLWANIRFIEPLSIVDCSCQFLVGEGDKGLCPEREHLPHLKN